MGNRRGPMKADFLAGTRVRIVDRPALERFLQDWRYHHPLEAEQLPFAGATAAVKSVGFYHGGDELYSLEGIPGIWHLACLQPAESSGRASTDLSAGTNVLIEDEGEGWFPLSLDRTLRGTIADSSAAHPGWYLVRLESRIELQEVAADTPSGLRQRFYERVLIGSRLVGMAIGSQPHVPVYVCLVPPGSSASLIDVYAGAEVRIWATCTVESTEK